MRKRAEIFEDAKGNNVFVQRDKVSGELAIVMGYDLTAYEVELTQKQAIKFARNILNTALEMEE